MVSIPNRFHRKRKHHCPADNAIMTGLRVLPEGRTRSGSFGSMKSQSRARAGSILQAGYILLYRNDQTAPAPQIPRKGEPVQDHLFQ